MEPTIRYQSVHEICATWGPMIIRVCDGARTEVDDLVRVRALFDEQLARWPAIGMLLVFTHDTPLPTAATQRHAADTMRPYEDRLVFAIAMLGLGFWSSAFRATLSSVLRFFRGGVAIEGSVEAAVARLTSDLVGVDPDGLQRAYELLWTQLEGSRRAAS